MTTSPCDESSNIGLNHPRTFLTQYTNIGWFGLNKTDNPALYVAVSIYTLIVHVFSYVPFIFYFLSGSSVSISRPVLLVYC